jgi:hypothetical protein
MAPWPTKSKPSGPDELGWPIRGYDELVAKFPALAEMDGLKLGDATIWAERWGSQTRLLLYKPELDLGMLEESWGPLVRFENFYAMWFDPTNGIRAHYPARSPLPVREKAVELSQYVPLLDRIAAAPDGFIAGAGPLLGQPRDALDGYTRWRSRHDDVKADEDVVVLRAPAGEWDSREVRFAIHISKRTNRIWSVGIDMRVDRVPADSAGVLERLHQRWGVSRTVIKDGRPVVVWTEGQLRVEAQLRDNGEPGEPHHFLRVDYNLTKLR